MIKQLIINNIALIESANINFESGFTVITGETGAGKSMILDCINFVIGSRIKNKILRPNTNFGYVIAVFDLNNNPNIINLLNDHAIKYEDNILIIRRNIDENNKSKAFVNDVLVSLNFLKNITEYLIEMHGQNTQQSLLSNSYHRKAIDEYAHLNDYAEETRNSYIEYKNAYNNLEELKNKQNQIAREEDYLRYVLKELEIIAPNKGEEDLLISQQNIAKKQSKILSIINNLRQIFEASDNSILSNLMRVEKEIVTIEDNYSENITKSLEIINIEIDEILRNVDQLYNKFNLDIDDIDKIEDRLYLLRESARKYRVTIDQLVEYHLEVKNKLELIDSQEENIKIANHKLSIAKENFYQKAKKLSDKRKEYATKLELEVADHLADLKMKDTKFIIDFKSLDETQWNTNGIDMVEFWAAINKGMPVQPIINIASGGELSRFMLALKIVIAQKSTLPILVFDEVDTGIGGAVADAVGMKLKNLSKIVQVITITHQPQVTAKADHHFKVTKEIIDDKTISKVNKLSKAEAKEEIARMLSGSVITDMALAAADSLML